MKTSNNKLISTYKSCLSCNKSQIKDKSFYLSNSQYDADGRMSICKSCLKKNIDYNNVETVHDILLQINRPFIYQLWISAGEEAKALNKDHFGVYIKTLQMKDFRDLCWKDSDFKINNSSDNSNRQTEQEQQKEDIGTITILESESESKNRSDVISMLGYDPFETEIESDKRHLYNKLVDFLDESTLEDSFKLPAVIEIVKTFNQIDKLNGALSAITSDIKSVSTNVGGIKSLIDAKEKMLKSVLALAKDNGISVNHNNNKSKGSGTLSGTIKQLQEKGFEEADVNIFDIETCAGMRQVADISNQSIVNQLQFDENDYTDMILQQREIIENLEQKTATLEEDNRLLRKELLKLKHEQGET